MQQVYAFDFFVILGGKGLVARIQALEIGQLPLNIFRTDALGKRTVETIDFRKLNQSVFKSAFNEERFAIGFSFRNLSVTGCNAFAINLIAGKVHHAPDDCHFRRTATQLFLFDIVPVEFVTDIHEIIGNFGCYDIFGIGMLIRIHVIGAFFINDNRIVIVHRFIKDIEETHIFLHGASLIEENVPAFAAAAKNAETIVAEFVFKLVVFASFLDAEVNVFQFDGSKGIAAVVQVNVGIVLAVVDNQCLIAGLSAVLQVGNAPNRFFLHRFAHAVKHSQSGFAAVAHTGNQFRAFFAARRQQKEAEQEFEGCFFLHEFCSYLPLEERLRR